jgi:hypothetical protein
MITKNDWNDALEAWAEEERERLGDSPSPEEVVAYLRGELSGAAAERVRALLVYDPALTPLLDERVPPPRKRFALRVYAVAATIVLAVLIAQWPRPEPSAPASHHELSHFRGRGPAVAAELSAGQGGYLLTVVPSEAPADAGHDIEIARGSKVLWRLRGVRPINNAFFITIPGGLLRPGTYTLNISVDGRRTDSYRFDVM